jgi:tetratricopeptide (TPR) repeat protein
MNHDDTVASTLYEVLGVAETATPEEIKKAYFRLVRKFRPEDYPEDFNRFTEAHKLLSDPRQRKEYDLMHRYGEQINALMNQALEAMEDDPTFAIKLCKQAVVIAPELPMPRRLLVRAFMSAREFVHAETEIRRLLVLSPEDTLLAFSLSRCLWLQDKNAEAEQEAQRLLSRAPEDVDIYFLLSRIYRDLDEPQQAVEILEQAILINDVEDIGDRAALLELLKIHVAELNATETAKTAQRIRNIIPAGDEDAANYVMACVYDLALDFFKADAYRGAYEVFQYIDTTLISDPVLLESVAKAGKIIGAHADALRMLDNDQLPPYLKRFVYSQYIDSDDEITEEQQEEIVEEIFGTAVQSPVEAQIMFRYIVRTYPHFAQDKSEFLQLIDNVINEELSKPATASTQTSPRLATPQPSSSYIMPSPQPDSGPHQQVKPARSASRSLFGGSCLLKIIGIVIFIYMLPILLHLLVSILPVIFVGALTVGAIIYFIKKS